MSNAAPLRVRVYRITMYGIATVLVLLAIVFSLARLTLQDLGNYREVIEQQVSSLLEQRVSIQGFDARLEGITPVLIFKDISLLHAESNDELARFAEARVGLAWLASLRERKLVPGEIAIAGLHMVVTRHPGGALTVQGLSVSQFDEAEHTAADTQLARWLFSYSDLSLENSSIIWQDNVEDKRYHFSDVNLHLRNRDQRHMFAGQMEVPEALGREVKFAADIEGASLHPRDWRGKFFVQAYAVDVQQWQQFRPQWRQIHLERGKLDMRLWGEWQDNVLARLAGDVSVYDARLSRGPTQAASATREVKLLGGLFDWQRGAEDWALQVKDLQLMLQGSAWPKADVSISFKAGAEDSYLFEAGYLRLEDLNSMASILSADEAPWRTPLQHLQPSGDLHDVAVQLVSQQGRPQEFVVRAEFDNVHASAWQHYPALQGFHGSVAGTLHHGELSIDNGFSTVYFPRLFRQAFALQALKTRIRWSKNDYGWMFSSDEVQTQTADVKARAGMYVHLPANAASPYLDLQVQFQDGDARQAANYYPVGIMSPALVHWLDQAIVAGDVRAGGAVFRGRLAEFPFRQQQGAFQVEFYADNVALNYQPDWPPLTNARVDARFSGEGMHITGVQAQLLQETTSENVTVEIPDFLQPELRVQASASGPTVEVFEFLTHTPIAPEGRGFVESIQVSGDSELDLSLSIPLSREVAARNPLHYRGRVQLVDSSFMLLDRAVDIRATQGVINFDETGLTARDISATILGEAASLEVYTRDSQDARPIQIVAQGLLDTALLAQRFAVPGLDKVSGKTRWQGVFGLPYHQQGRSVPAKLALTSSLEQVQLDLPAPFNKEATEVAPTLLGLEFSSHDRTQVRLGYADALQAVMELRHEAGRTQVSKGTVHFGEREVELPRPRMLRIEGATPAIPLQEWISLLTEHKGAGVGAPFDWQGLPVELAMQGLHLLVETDDAAAADASTLNILPSQWPLLNGHIDSLRVNDTLLGALELDVERERTGFRIHQLLLTTPFSRVSASGDWHYRRQHKTQLQLAMTSSDIGAQLGHWGYAAILRGGEVSDAQMQISWDDSPFGFAFAKLRGNMTARIESGNIVEVKTGAGRLFGLLSLSALPRRLFLDFADMGSGFSFDSMQLQFDIGAGDAVTRQLLVESTLANVVISGRTGLAQKDYDLEVLVIPNLSGTAPLPGYLLWGPQVGTVLLFFKQLFGKAFDKSIASQYRVTGSWDKPVIEKVVSAAPEPS
ncbi:MAG: DUF3971 domain-containing protein [Gammaproteobacteria bacterium]